MRLGSLLATLLLLGPVSLHAQVPLRGLNADFIRDSSAKASPSNGTPLPHVPNTQQALHRLRPSDVACTMWTSDLKSPAGDRVYDEDFVNGPPTLLTVGKRAYPPKEERAGIGGRVVLRFVIDTLGDPEPCSFSTVELSDPAFEQAAYIMVVGSAFRPATQDGHRVPVLVTQTVKFNP
jgi:TonB family protein